MTTSNIISTPNITGNIGSCATQISWVNTDRTFWKIQKRQIATNSCTGQITTYDTYDYSDMAGGLLLIIGLIVVIILFAFFENM